MEADKVDLGVCRRNSARHQAGGWRPEAGGLDVRPLAAIVVVGMHVPIALSLQSTGPKVRGSPTTTRGPNHNNSLQCKVGASYSQTEWGHYHQTSSLQPLVSRQERVGDFLRHAPRSYGLNVRMDFMMQRYRQ